MGALILGRISFIVRRITVVRRHLSTPPRHPSGRLPRTNPGRGGASASWRPRQIPLGLGVLWVLGTTTSHLQAQNFVNPFAESGAGVAFPMGQGNGFTELPGINGDAGDNFLIQRGMPYNPVVGRGGGGHYRMRIGRATGSVSTGLVTTYTDNANLVTSGSGLSAQDDLSMSASLGVGFSMPLGRDNSLQFSVGLGYTKHLNQNSPDQISIGPSSQWDYRMNIGSARVTLYDRISTPGSLTAAPQISGTGSLAAVDFHRLSNDIGISSSWQRGKSTTFSTGYDFVTDVGLGDQFAQQDHMSHSVSAAVFERLDRQWTVGVSSSASMTQFFSRFQNDSDSFGAGPTLSWQPTRRINVSASVRYTVSQAKQTGVIADTHSFAGMTYDVGVQQALSSRVSHGISAGTHSDLGIGSNFARSFSTSYGLAWHVSQRVSLNANASYVESGQSGAGYDFTAIPAGSLFIPSTPPQLLTAAGITPLPSGTLLTPTGLMALPRPAEDTQFLSLSTSVSFMLTDHVSAGLSYSRRIRLSNLAGHGYGQDTISLSLSYAF